MKISHLFLAHKEGKILLFGLVLLGVYIVFLLFTFLFYPDYFQALLSITITNIFFGRMAGLSIGVASQMDISFLVALNFTIETIMVLILYPLFVLSWNKLELISYQPLNDFFNKSKKTATTYQPMIQKYGIFGLILFVLTPFAMTGPVVGSFVGYLIGFRHWVTLFVVLLSTFIAILLWVYLIKNFEKILVVYSDTLSIGFLLAALALLLWYLLKRYLNKTT
ncbi:MAG: hypothetical protein COA92_03620 [Sulfurovum sp.]|nr:MAG: hypothetical protein COA92_03620 [Sulfurovum sp.]